MTMGAKVVPRVDLGSLQSEESGKRVLEWTPFPGRVSFLHSHWGFLSAKGTPKLGTT